MSGMERGNFRYIKPVQGIWTSILLCVLCCIIIISFPDLFGLWAPLLIVGLLTLTGILFKSFTHQQKELDKTLQAHLLTTEKLMREKNNLLKSNAALKRNLRNKTRSERILIQSAEKYWQLYNTTPVGYLEIDTKGQIISVNQTGADLLGYTVKEMVSKPVCNFFSPRQHKITKTIIQNKITQKKSLNNYQTECISKTGEIIYVDVVEQFTTDHKNQITGIRFTLDNISEHKRIEEILSHERDLLHTLLDNIPDTIYFKDEKSRFTRVNKAQAHVLGIDDPESAIGKTDGDFFDEKHAHASYADEQKIINSKQSLVDKIERLKMSDGEYHWVTATKVPIINKKNRVIGLVGISRDITERKHAEEKQNQLLKEIEMANQELKEFAYVISHDLKAPLRAIGSLVDWIYTDYKGRFDSQGKEMLDLIVGRVKRMNDLIDGVLQYSRVGRIKENRTKINLNKIIQEVIETIAPPSNIHVEIENKLPTIHSERTRIKQVFQNLLNNAIKYNDKENGEIRIFCKANNGCWKFGITDNGPGIDKKYFEKIFQIFQTLAPRDKIESTGVGLALVKKIVEMYGGKVWVESEIDRGSTFFFTLPKNKYALNNA